ncbi:MAG: hypothetical protein L0Y56_10295 [Nitrospira sp.]|nr:hypothetical protein [Nitrospira sp.]
MVTADMIKNSTRKFKETGDREVRILAKIDSREDLPNVFTERGLFILPVKNGEYAIIKGEGFHDIQLPKSKPEVFKSKLTYELKSAKIGESEMQRLDYAFNTGLVHHFAGLADDLRLQIRGRKYTPEFEFFVGKYKIKVRSVQTEVDAGYEGRDVIILVEAKSFKQANFIIRQLYYPFRQWSLNTGKNVRTMYYAFRPASKEHVFWEYSFEDPLNYNSILLTKAKSYVIET